jgi:hypothetical protein
MQMYANRSPKATWEQAGYGVTREECCDTRGMVCLAGIVVPDQGAGSILPIPSASSVSFSRRVA